MRMCSSLEAASKNESPHNAVPSCMNGKFLMALAKVLKLAVSLEKTPENVSAVFISDTIISLMASSAKGWIADGLPHDLDNPFAAIYQFLCLLLKR